jgi:kynurenine formamidase
LIVDFHKVGEELSNWGRWGGDDRRGTLNLITPERIAAAAGLARRGEVFDLGIPLDNDGPQPASRIGSKINPVHLMSIMPGDLDLAGDLDVADDWIVMPLQAGTHWDGLAHLSYGGQMYNGVSTDTLSTLDGATDLAIDAISPGIVGRGVLLDFVALRGAGPLDKGEAIGIAEIEEAERRQGVSVGPGDVLLVRTGWWDRFAEHRDGERFLAGEPGLANETARWLHEREVAAVAADNWGVEVVPSEDPAVALPLHAVLIRDMGMTLGEIFDLRGLAADCAADGVWEFLFVSTTLKVTNGVGSPASPLAIK